MFLILAASMAFHRVALLILAFFVWMPVVAIAQTPAAPTTPAATTSTDQLLKPEQLDALVAPIALYPDNLLSLVLMASTYPLEVVQADRWVAEHKNLKGEKLKAEVDKQASDESVKSLVPTPDVLSMMSKKLDWTLKLGDAVLAQQADVMDAVQRVLRSGRSLRCLAMGLSIIRLNATVTEYPRDRRNLISAALNGNVQTPFFPNSSMISR